MQQANQLITDKLLCGLSLFIVYLCNIQAGHKIKLKV